VITSVPDVSETGLPLDAWRTWFRRACTLIFERVDPDQVVLLYQTDVIVEGGRWESKSALCMQAAASVPDMRLVWHKIVVLRSPRTVRGSTAGYTHLMCFSREHKQSPGVRTPDVLANRGPMLWARAMGLRACEVAVDYVRTQLRSSSSSSSSSLSSPSSGGCHTVIDPFCGSGSVLAMANARGLHSFGVDHSRSRARQAAELQPQRVMDELAQDAHAHEAAHNDLFGEGSGVAVGTDPSASPSVSPLPSPAAGASGSAAAASGPFRTAEEIARRTARKERKEARKALGLTQKQQQQEDKRQAQLKQQQQQQQQPQQPHAHAVLAPADS
jgi:hypothetical protein